MICGNEPEGKYGFGYRTGSELGDFFADCGVDRELLRSNSSRAGYTAEILQAILGEAPIQDELPSEKFGLAISYLMDKEEALISDDCFDPQRELAIKRLNRSLGREGLEAYYADDQVCYLRNSKTRKSARPARKAERALTPEEKLSQTNLLSYLNSASEDDITENVILPLFQELGFRRISVAGHKDKALEFGKDLWMKFTLPTRNVLYFGVQVKRGKIDAAGKTKGTNSNVAEILNQIGMMLGHVRFDPDINKRRLVDHAFIVSGGEITKQARQWLGERLDLSQRSQIMFLDRSDLLQLFVTHALEVPNLEKD